MEDYNDRIQWKEFHFSPKETLKQSELNELLAVFFSSMITIEDDNGYIIKDFGSSFKNLVKVMIDLGVTIRNEDIFDKFSDDVKQHFIISHRTGERERIRVSQKDDS